MSATKRVLSGQNSPKHAISREQFIFQGETPPLVGGDPADLDPSNPHVEALVRAGVKDTSSLEVKFF